MAASFEKLKKAAREGAQKGKDRIDQYVLNNRLEKAEKQLGALVYSLRKAGREDEAAVEQLVAEIDRVKRLMESFEPEADDPLTVYECPSCGAGVLEDAMFCGRCDAELPTK